jgi:hypothetical protein
MQPPTAANPMLKQYTHDPAVVAAVRAEYRRRKKKLHLLLVGWMIYGMLILWMGVVPFDLLPYFLFGGLIVFGGVSSMLWRCPNCGTSFGRSWWMDACPRCKIVLEGDDPSPPA